MNEAYLTKQVVDLGCGVDLNICARLLDKYIRKQNHMLTFWNVATVWLSHNGFSRIDFREDTFRERHSVIGGLLF